MKPPLSCLLKRKYINDDMRNEELKACLVAHQACKFQLMTDSKAF